MNRYTKNIKQKVLAFYASDPPLEEFPNRLEFREAQLINLRSKIAPQPSPSNPICGNLKIKSNVLKVLLKSYKELIVQLIPT